MFVLVLGYSRYIAAWCTTSMDLKTLLLCHEKCFQRVGGVARQLVYDNTKTVALGRDVENKPIWQSRFMEFALHYGFRPVVCAPGRPRSKGKLESVIKYRKRHFCSGRRFINLADLNMQLQVWLDTVANVWIYGTTGVRPIDRLGEERLGPMPKKPFPTAVRFMRKASRDGFISYHGVLYSVPWRFAGGEVSVEEEAGGRIRVWWHGQLVAEHTMPKEGSRRVTDPRQMDGFVEAQRKGQASGLLQCFPEVEKRCLSVNGQLAGVVR